MNTVEQILIKLGFDASPVESGSKQSEQHVKKLGETAHHSMLHATRASEGFKKALEQIKDSSPLVGATIQTALSPIGGTLAAAGVAAAYVNSQIEEMNRLLDEQALKNARPLPVLEGKAQAADWLKKFNLGVEDKAKVDEQARQRTKIVDTIQNEVDALKNKYDIEQKTADLETKMHESRLRNAYASGSITQGDYLSQSNALAKSSAEATQARNVARDTAVQNYYKDVLAGRRGNLSGALASAQKEYDESLAAARAYGVQRGGYAKYADTKSEYERNKQRAEELRNELPARRLELDKQRERLEWVLGLGMQRYGQGFTDEQMLNMPGLYSAPGRASGDYQKWAVLNEAVKGMESELAQLKGGNGSPGIIASQEGKLNAMREPAEAEKRFGLAEENLRSLKDAADAVKKSADAAGRVAEKTAQTPGSYEQQQYAAASRSVLPTVEQLATMGQWQSVRATPTSPAHFEYVQSPASRIAQQIQNLQNDALNAAAWGNMGRHNDDVLAANRLKEQLASAGIIDEKQAARDTVTILNQIKTGGLDVRVTNGA